MVSKPTMWVLGPLVVVVVAVIWGGLALQEVKKIYPTDDPALAKLHGDQCERPQDDHFIAESQNTWSNLAYVLAGALVLLRFRSLLGALWGAQLILIGVASAYYHATLSEGPQILDVAWIYAVLFSAILYATNALWNSDQPWPIRWWAWIVVGLVHGVALVVSLALSDHTGGVVTSFLIISVLLVPGLSVPVVLWTRFRGRLAPCWYWLLATLVLTIFGYLMRKIFVSALDWDSEALFPILVGNLIALTVLVVLARMRFVEGSWNRWFWLELVGMGLVMGVGIVCRLQDGYKVSDGKVTLKWLCSPDRWLQAHAVWHVASAAALLFTYDFLSQLDGSGRSELVDRPTVFPELTPGGG
jgi:hypothetical protein